MPDLPTGTVIFLFTDIEGSTKLWEHYPRGLNKIVRSPRFRRGIWRSPRPPNSG